MDDARYQQLREWLGNTLLSIAPQGWRRMDLRYKMAAADQNMAFTVYLADGSTPAINPPPEVISALTELRRVMYEPGMGTWWSARLSLEPPSSMNLSFNKFHNPPWGLPLSAADLAQDLQMFPRDDAYIPDWLRQKLQEQN